MRTVTSPTVGRSKDWTLACNEEGGSEDGPTAAVVDVAVVASVAAALDACVAAAAE